MTTLFISHASEDKDKFVRPLAEALKLAGVRVWYDEYELTVGDSLRQKIDDGLARADYGVVVLSDWFFQKDWPQRELDGLFALETKNKKLILPIWHGVTKEAVAEYSPMLAGRLGAKSERGISEVVQDLQRAINASDRKLEVSVNAEGTTALQTLANKLSSKEDERRRLDSSSGADEVAEAAKQIAAAVIQKLEAINQVNGKQRFHVVRWEREAAFDIAGPCRVLISTGLQDIFLNTGSKAKYYVRIGRGHRSYPHPGNVETLEEINFLPRALLKEPIKWSQEDKKVILTSEEVAEQILKRFAKNIEGLEED